MQIRSMKLTLKNGHAHVQLHSSQAKFLSGVRLQYFRSEISRFKCEIMTQSFNQIIVINATL